MIEEYRALEEVEFAEPNYIVTATDIAAEKNFSNRWELSSTAQTERSFFTDIWDIQTNHSPVISAVIDTGVDYYHET